MWNPDPDSRTGRLFANRTFMLVMFGIFLLGSIAFTVSTFSSKHPYADDPYDFHFLSQLLGPWIWPLGDGLFLALIIYTLRTDQAQLSRLSHRRSEMQSPSAVRSRLGRLAIVGGAVFLVAWAIAAVVGDDTSHVRQAIGAGAILVGVFAMMGSRGWGGSAAGLGRTGSGLAS